jgi:rhamnogalacturonyl hydrolase YesR
VIDRKYIFFRISGGKYPETCYLALVQSKSGKELFRVTGHQSEYFRGEYRDVSSESGSEVFIRVVDKDKGGWLRGHANIDLDHVVLTDHRPDELVAVQFEGRETTVRESSITTVFTGKRWNVERTIVSGHVPGMLHVTVKAVEKDTKQPIVSIEDRLSISLPARGEKDPEGPFDLLWSQNLKYAKEDVVAHWCFKSPALIAQQGLVWVAIVPDLRGMTKSDIEQLPPALDLEAVGPEGAWLGCGIIPSEPRYHSGFVRTSYGKRLTSPKYSYWIITGESPRYEAFRAVTSFLWKEFGEKEFVNSPDLQRNAVRKELCLFDDWRKDTWHTYATKQYAEFELDGTKCGILTGAFSLLIQFDSWFQSLRTAYGWYSYGKRMGDNDIMSKAERHVTTALKAPGKDGFTSTIYNIYNKKWESDGAGFQDSYHTFCNSWTAYWLLQWIKDYATARKDEVMPRVRSYAEALLKIQLKNGCIPSWIRFDGSMREELGAFNAETAGSSLFLAEFYSVTNEEKYLEAAKKGMDFVVKEVFPRRRWFDFETYKSCSFKPFDFYDPVTAQFPQNNMSTMQAAMASARLHDLTGEERYRELALRLADDVAITQQVWNHPCFTPKLVGGMTTQNSDTEWSDARQCYAAIIFLKAYDLSGKLEYLQRAVAAARSTFAVAPWENWAHTGYPDVPGALTGIHWGTGSAMATVEMMCERLGDAYVNVSRKHGVGFNACTIENLKIDGGNISFWIVGVREWKGKKGVVRFEGMEAGKKYSLNVNGINMGQFEGSALGRDGLSLTIATQ